MPWSPASGVVIALFSFSGNGQHEVPLAIGDQINLQETNESKTWYRGTVLGTQKCGIFPANYVQARQTSTPAREESSLMQELSRTLTEWGLLMKSHFEERQYRLFHDVCDRLSKLVRWRRELMGVIDDSRKEELREEVTSFIEAGRRDFSLDVIVRGPDGKEADETNTSLIQLYGLHCDREEGEEGAVSGRSKPALNDNEDLIHLHVEWKALIANVGEEAELTFTLFDTAAKRCVTDQYKLVLTKMGMPDQTKIGNVKFVFKRLSAKQLQMGNLALVVRICRVGKMIYEDTKQKSKNLFRRPFGVGVLPITPSMMNTKEEDTEYTLELYNSKEEAAFSQLFLSILNNTGGYEVVSRSKGVAVGLTFYSGDYNNVKERVPELANTEVVERFGFGDDDLGMLTELGLRNDIYFDIVGGEFLQDRKTAAKNVEMTLEIRRNATGQPIENCVSTGSGEDAVTTFETMILYHDNKPIWNERVKVSLSAEDMEKCHVYWSVRHCSTGDSKGKGNGEFAFAWTLLTNADGTACSGVQQVTTWKPTTKKGDPCFYLKGGPQPGGVKLQARKEVINFALTTASTELTSEAALISLFKWKESPGKEADILRKLTFINHFELLKFLPLAFDALFDMLTTHEANDSIPRLVFNAIVFLIGILVDEKAAAASRFHRLEILNTYCQKGFKSSSVHTPLMRIFKETVQSVAPTNQTEIRSSIKALEFLFKFIVRSYQLSGEKNSTDFKGGVRELLGALDNLMKLSEPAWVVGAQTMCAKYFSTILDDLEVSFESVEFCELVKNFLSSIEYDEAKKQMNSEKLRLMDTLLKHKLSADARAVVAPFIINELKLHFGRTPEQAIQSANVVLHVLQGITDLEAESELMATCELLTPVLETYCNLHEQIGEAGRGTMATLVLSFFDMISEEQFNGLIEDKSEDEAIAFVGVLAASLRIMLTTARAYPASWTSLNVYQMLVVAKVVQQLVKQLSIFPADHAVWQDVYEALCACVVCSDLRLESFSTYKKDSIFSRHGDLRIQFAELFLEVFRSSSSTCALDLAGRVLEMGLVGAACPVVNDVCSDIFFSLLELEYHTSDGGGKEGRARFQRISHQTIDALDAVVQDLTTSAFYKGFFNSIKEKLGGADVKEGLSKAAIVLVDDMVELVVLLGGLRSLPDADEYEDDRTIATLELMQYLISTGRTDVYVKYVHLLKNLHNISGLWAEAGFTVLLHAELLDWDPNTTLVQEGSFKKETAFQRKEGLYLKAVEFFNMAKLWESGLTLLAELRDQYQNVTFDYPKVAETMRKEAEFFSSIYTEDRFFCEYFRVAYYGKGFPSTLKDKEFVYRGFELERIGDFQSGLSAKFPNAEILMANNPPSEEIVNGDGQYIQIALLKAVSSYEPPERAAVPLPERLAKFHEHNGVQEFKYSRRINKVKKNKENEFATLWTEETIIKTKDAFPTVHRRSEVVQRTCVEISPVQNAVIQMRDKNAQLRALMESSRHQSVAPSSFSMAISGTIDAAVNGGTNQFMAAFLTKEYEAENPGDAACVEELKSNLADQLDVLDAALELHQSIVSDEMRGLHDHLESIFPDMKTSVSNTIANGFVA